MNLIKCETRTQVKADPFSLVNIAALEVKVFDKYKYRLSYWKMWEANKKQLRVFGN